MNLTVPGAEGVAGESLVRMYDRENRITLGRQKESKGKRFN